MSRSRGDAWAAFSAAVASIILVSCASTPGDELAEITLDPSRDALLILETSSLNLGISGKDPYVLQQYDPVSGKAAPSRASFQIAGTGGRFVVAQVPAGFHVVQSYDGLHGPFCYDVQSYGVTAAAGSVMLLGKLDLPQTQKDAEAAAQAFNRFAAVPETSPQARDHIDFELTRNFSPIDRVSIKRELFAKTQELPFEEYAKAEHTFRVVRRLYLTSLEAPRLARAPDESLTAAKEFIRASRPDLVDRAAHAELTPVKITPSGETCAPGSIASHQ
jgi:hypothetical protein